MTYPLTLTALKDSELGYSSKRFFGGPGAKKRLAAMGFTAAESDRVISGGGSVDNAGGTRDTGDTASQ